MIRSYVAEWTLFINADKTINFLGGMVEGGWGQVGCDIKDSIMYLWWSQTPLRSHEKWISLQVICDIALKLSIFSPEWLFPWLDSMLLKIDKASITHHLQNLHSAWLTHFCMLQLSRGWRGCSVLPACKLWCVVESKESQHIYPIMIEKYISWS